MANWWKKILAQNQQYREEDLYKLQKDLQNITDRIERAQAARNNMTSNDGRIPKVEQLISYLKSQKEQGASLLRNVQERTKAPGDPNRQNLSDAALKPSGGNPFTRLVNIFDAAHPGGRPTRSRRPIGRGFNPRQRKPSRIT
jgi:hypothetical protein